MKFGLYFKQSICIKVPLFFFYRVNEYDILKSESDLQNVLFIISKNLSLSVLIKYLHEIANICFCF